MNHRGGSFAHFLLSLGNWASPAPGIPTYPEPALQASLEQLLSAQPEREGTAAPWWPVSRGSRSHLGGGAPFPSPGTAAVSAQVNECPSSVPRTQQAHPHLGPWPLLLSLRNVLLPDLRWQPLSHSLALRPNFTSSGREVLLAPPLCVNSLSIAPRPLGS